jgi:hypothetical protein
VPTVNVKDVWVGGDGPVPADLMIIGEAPGCISGGSLVDTGYRDKSLYPKGIPIKDLVGISNIYVFSLDLNTVKIVLKKATNIRCTGTKPVYKITYEWFQNRRAGKIIFTDSITVTSNHKLLLRSPHSCRKYNDKPTIYKSINDGLVVGDSLMPFYRHSYERSHCHIGIGHDEMILEGRFLLGCKLGHHYRRKKNVTTRTETKKMIHGIT